MPDLDLNKIMEMAQSAQAELQRAQQNLESIEVEGASGGGLVKIRATASIDDSLLQPSEKSMVEDLVAAALNDARAKADQAANSEMQKVTSGLPLPPGFSFPG